MAASLISQATGRFLAPLRAEASNTSEASTSPSSMRYLSISARAWRIAAAASCGPAEAAREPVAVGVRRGVAKHQAAAALMHAVAAGLFCRQLHAGRVGARFVGAAAVLVLLCRRCINGLVRQVHRHVKSTSNSHIVLGCSSVPSNHAGQTTTGQAGAVSLRGGCRRGSCLQLPRLVVADPSRAT